MHGTNDRCRLQTDEFPEIDRKQKMPGRNDCNIIIDFMEMKQPS